MKRSPEPVLMSVIDAIDALCFVNDIPYADFDKVGFGRIMELHAWCWVVEDRMSNYIRILMNQEDEEDE